MLLFPSCVWMDAVICSTCLDDAYLIRKQVTFNMSQCLTSGYNCVRKINGTVLYCTPLQLPDIRVTLVLVWHTSDWK